MAANNMSNDHVSLDVLSTLLLLQQGNLYKLQQKILLDFSRSSRLELELFTGLRRIDRKTSVLESLFNKVAGLQICNFIKKRLQSRCFLVNFAKFLPISKNICERLLPHLKYYTPANNTAEAVAEYSKTAKARGRNIV